MLPIAVHNGSRSVKPVFPCMKAAEIPVTTAIILDMRSLVTDTGSCDISVKLFGLVFWHSTGINSSVNNGAAIIVTVDSPIDINEALANKAVMIVKDRTAKVNIIPFFLSLSIHEFVNKTNAVMKP